ncbi:LacI family DNA-binding transcriptional regulator [Leifsonia sp. NPDC014704]|uniref:LacI family DNA-binding transcriptional regulator n=1 Tax=Leifsonia sp. NPDC014704 TaxID=3364123 RepID=UPI0036F465B1
MFGANQMARPPRLRDVAERAEVSIALVSSYLNTPHLVGKKSAVKIAQAIEDLHFVPNESARQLRRGVSRMIAFVAFDVGDPFFSSVARGAQARASEAGLYLVLADTNGHAETEREYLAMFEEQRVRGVILAPAQDPREYLASLRRSGVPAVLIDQRPPDGRSSAVVVDNVLGGREAAEHLLGLGRRRIAVLGGEASIPQVLDRRAGVEAAVAGVEGASMLVVDTHDRDAAAGREAAVRVLALPNRPDAIFCINDTIAAGALQVLAENRVRVPEDIAVIGYNDTAELSGLFSLSSVSQPHEAFGAAAVELLLDEIGADAGALRRQIVFSPKLVVRQSSAG